MYIGAHVSAVGGVQNTPSNANEEHLECFQFFSRSPRGGKAPELTPEIIKSFQDGCKKYHMRSAYIHTPYYINFASTNSRIRYGSISVIREELERASLLGVKAVMTHLGSSKGQRKSEARKKVIEGINKALDGYKGSSMFLIENSAGAGDIIGADFEEIQNIILSIENKNAGMCLDTQHSFASGYNWKDAKKRDIIIHDLEKMIGLEKISVIHINDSKVECGSRKDRHEHIGFGYIGKEAFEWFLNHPKMKHVDAILETESEKRADDVRLLKKLRKK